MKTCNGNSILSVKGPRKDKLAVKLWREKKKVRTNRVGKEVQKRERKGDGNWTEWFQRDFHKSKIL